MNGRTVVTPGSYFRQLNILFFALIMGQILFVVIGLFINSNQSVAVSFPDDLEKVLILLVPIVVVINVSLSFLLFVAKIKPLRNINDWEQQLKGYRSALLLRYAIMEAPSLFSVVVYLLTGNNTALLFIPLILLLFFTQRPRPAALAKHLALHDDERILLQDKEAVLYEQEWAVS